MKKDYMTQLERAARWRLPAQEAEDVIADYRDIVSDPELLRGLGKPQNVIKPLTQPKEYKKWLAVFALLSACILIPGMNAIGWFGNLIRICFAVDTWGWVPLMHLGPVLAFIGSVGTLVWFRKNGLKGDKLPRAISVLLALLGVWTVAILTVDWYWIGDPQGFAEMLGWTRPTYFGMTYGPPDYQVSRSVDLLCSLTQCGGIITTLLGLFALVKARTDDRRWAAVYVFSAAAMIVTLETFALICRQGWEPDDVYTLQWSSLVYCAVVGLLGAAGTGVALC